MQERNVRRVTPLPVCQPGRLRQQRQFAAPRTVDLCHWIRIPLMRRTSTDGSLLFFRIYSFSCVENASKNPHGPWFPCMSQYDTATKRRITVTDFAANTIDFTDVNQATNLHLFAMGISHTSPVCSVIPNPCVEVLLANMCIQRDRPRPTQRTRIQHRHPPVPLSRALRVA